MNEVRELATTFKPYRRNPRNSNDMALRLAGRLAGGEALEEVRLDQVGRRHRRTKQPQGL